MARIANEAIRIDGMAEFRAAIKSLDRAVPGAVRKGLNGAMALVLRDARGLTPVRSGHAVASIRSASTQSYARVSAGGSEAPYFGFLDYGNKVHSGHGVGRGDSVPRAFRPTGRILYPAFLAERQPTLALVNEALAAVAREHGLAVTTSGS